MNIKDIVKDNYTWFNRYRHGVMYYYVELNNSEKNKSIPEYFEYPVPLEDIQDATLKSCEKAIHLMRYIRKAMNEGTFIQIKEPND